MVVDSVSSPRRRSQPANFIASLSKKQASGLDESGAWSILFSRHRFFSTLLSLWGLQIHHPEWPELKRLFMRPKLLLCKGSQLTNSSSFDLPWPKCIQGHEVVT